MSKEHLARRLRPYLFTSFKRSQCQCPARTFFVHSRLRDAGKERDVTHDYEKRLDELKANRSLSQCYPRLPQSVARNRLHDSNDLSNEISGFEPGETDTDRVVAVAGRVKSIRTAGSKLIFMDLQSGDSTLQTVCHLSKLQEADANITAKQLKSFTKLARKGDVYSVTGYPHRTARGEKSVLAAELPVLLSPSLHQIPEKLEDPEARMTSRHVDMLVNPEAIQTLRVRHQVEQGLQTFLNDRKFTKVNTPILGAGAGGAAARPFETEATEFDGQKLNLRIAPELWLKRLVVGGLDRVYEIGPAFRNEGVDATHNPEFQICEFYQAYATLQDLMDMTRDLITHLKEDIETISEKNTLIALPALDKRLSKHFDEVEFIPTLEAKLGCNMPNLDSPEAYQTILDLFKQNQIPTPSNPTLPRLLDALSAHYLESLSTTNPIFITHHPACMSPLSKHFLCPKTHQTVAARAELFIAAREYANMYEEENSPFEQRRKFEEQLKQREKDDEAMESDEQYLRTLEWGLPPTGGWGCGVDRLVMLFSGRERMSDVLAFGSLRNVVGLGRGR